MFNFNSFRQKSPQQRFLSILGFVMFLFYTILGLTLIIWKDMPVPLERTYKVLLGCLLIVYGVFRFMRIFKNDDD